MRAEYLVHGRILKNFKWKYKSRMTILNSTEKSADYCLMCRISLTCKFNWRDIKIAFIIIPEAIVLNL